jgi:sulfate permease, SulP family
MGGIVQVYSLATPLFFASVRSLYEAFDYDGDPSHVVVDLSEAPIADLSGLLALDGVAKRWVTVWRLTVPSRPR